LSEELTDGKPMHTRLFPMLVAIMLFNIFLCYVWFRTNRSNREYLKVRFERALQIEDDPDMSNVIQLYHLQQLILKDSRYAKHSSSWWETQLPSAFMIAWFAIVIAGAFDSDSFVFAIVAGLSIALVVGAIAWIERTGWPQAIRGTVKPSLESQPVAQGKMDKVH